MPDFMIVPMEMCSSMDISTYNVRGYTQTGLFSEMMYPQCTCPAYQYGKRTINFGGQLYPEVCKHIKEIESETCGWHEQWGIHQTTKGICPECGSPTVIVRVAV